MEPGYLVAISGDGREQLRLPLPDVWTDARSSGVRLSPDRKKIVRIKHISRINVDPQDDLLGSASIMDLEQKRIISIPDRVDCYGDSVGSWSPDGTRLVTACNNDLAMISFPNEKATILFVHCGSFPCEGVQWSPDGKWISFSSLLHALPGSAPDLFVVSTDCLSDPDHCFEKIRGPFKTYIDPSYSSSYKREWSPDAKYLLAPVAGPGGILQLEFINVQTEQIEHTIQIPGADWDRNRALAWSPDGKQIAFYQINDNNDSLADPTRPPADGIYLIPAAGGTPVRIAGSPKTWTPLFQWISVPHPFAPGAKYTITLAGNGLNLRDQPSQTGKPLKVLKAGDEITIVKGPILTDGYTWWQMRAKDGVEGWAEDLPDWYAP
jgi:Tol biopolymer transport system component